MGTATERRGGSPGRDPNINQGYYYDPFYYGYGYSPFYSSRARYGYSPYGFPGYGFGLGYFGYDPFDYGGGYGGGGYDPYYQGGSGSYSSGQYRDTGTLRLKVKPSNAQVYVDGYYVGVIDSFDGAFQRLGIEAGSHRIEIRAEGYQPVQFEVMVTPGETITYKGELKRQ